MGDRFVLRYAPSCQILKYCHDREPINHPQKAGTVADATSDLVYARFECEIIGQTLRILLTIGTGFLLAGARAVVSTLWSVDQLSTAIFCVFYYQFREEGYDRGLAIQKAQKELRELTGSELYRRFNKDLHGAPL